MSLDNLSRTAYNEDHEAFRELARDFVEKEVVPAYPEWEKGGRMPRAVFEKMGALGMLGMAIPEEYGGSGLGAVGTTLVLVEVNQACPSTGTTLSVHNSLTSEALLRFGSEGPFLVRGEEIPLHGGLRMENPWVRWERGASRVVARGEERASLVWDWDAPSRSAAPGE